MSTVNQLISAHGVEIDPHLDREATVPVSAGVQRQGDVIVIPAALADLPAGWAKGFKSTPVAREGVAVVRGEVGGNTHRLLADGAVNFGTLSSGGLDLGVLTVEPGATAYLAHEEHGYAGIAPGQYVIRRQREQADEIRMVAD